RRADLVRAVIEGRPVAETRVYGGDARQLRDACRLVGWHDEREAVDDDAVAPADEAAGYRASDACDDFSLCCREAGEVGDARRRPQVEPVPARGRRVEGPVGPD